MGSNYEGHPWGRYLNLKPNYVSGDLFFIVLVSKKSLGGENVSSDLPDHFCNLISYVGAQFFLCFWCTVCLCWKSNHKTSWKTDMSNKTKMSQISRYRECKAIWKFSPLHCTCRWDAWWSPQNGVSYTCQGHCPPSVHSLPYKWHRAGCSVEDMWPEEVESQAGSFGLGVSYPLVLTDKLPQEKKKGETSPTEDNEEAATALLIPHTWTEKCSKLSL